MEVFRLGELRNRWKPDGALGPDGEVIPPDDHHEAAVAPNCARTRRTRIRCRPIPCSTASCNAWSRRRCGRRHRRGGLRSRDGAPRRAAALSRRIQAPPVRAGREGRPEEFRPRPALSDRQPLPRSRQPAPRPTRRSRREAAQGRRAVRGVGRSTPGSTRRRGIPSRRLRGEGHDRVAVAAAHTKGTATMTFDLIVRGANLPDGRVWTSPRKAGALADEPNIAAEARVIVEAQGRLVRAAVRRRALPPSTPLSPARPAAAQSARAPCSKASRCAANFDVFAREQYLGALHLRPRGAQACWR